MTDLANLFRQDSLELTILPTEGCNLRCKYCYVDHNSLVMSNDVISNIKALIERRAPTLKYVRIGWFGGEPLLQKDIILDLSRYVFDLKNEYPSIDFQGGMSTNGIFLDIKTMEALVAVNINAFQISLDGPKEFHDQLRVHPNGSGSFAKIWENLLNLKKSKLVFEVIIRIHISHDNIKIIPDFLEEIYQAFGGDNRFQIFFKALAPLSKEDTGTKYFSEQEQEQIISGFSEKLNDRMPESEASKNNDQYICYAARPTSFVIRPDGSLIKCTIGLDDDFNQIGKLLPGGTLSIDQDKMRCWIAGATILDRTLMRCPRQGITNPE